MSLTDKLKILAISGALAINHPLASKADLVAYWNFDEGFDNIVYDSSGNGNNGTLQGTTSWTTNGISNNALNFNAEGSYVLVPYSSSIGELPEVRLEAWVKRNSNTGGMIISKNGPYYLSIRDNKIEGGVYAGEGWGEIRGITELEIDKWYKIAMSYDKSHIKVYLNELEDALIPKTGDILVTGQNLYIGFGQPGHDQYFDGIIDEVKIYNSANVPLPYFTNISRTDDNIVLQVNTINSQLYMLESSTNLSSWQNITNFVGELNTNLTEIVLPAQTENRKFYRIKSL